MERVANVFGQPAISQQAVVNRVTREAAEECEVGSCAIAPVLDDCVAAAVQAVWESRIKAFVPLLALRHVRCCIRAGTCDCGEC